MTRIESLAELNTRSEELQNQITKCLDKHAPVRRKRVREFKSHWNSELNDLQERLHKLYKEYQEEPK